MTNRVLIIIGTFGQAFIDCFDGKVLAIDTAETVSHLMSPSVQPIHLIPNETGIKDVEIPQKLVTHGGRDGSALIESYAYWLLKTNNWLKETIERFVCDATEIFVIPSSGGGTGNGTYDEIIKILRELKVSGRLIVLHPIHSAINPQKQLSRIKSLQKTGTCENETHILIKSLNTIREVLSLSGKEIDAINEIVVNLNSKKNPGETDLTLLLIRKKNIDEIQFKKEIERDVLSSLFSRYSEGRGQISTAVLQRLKMQTIYDFKEILNVLNKNISFDEMGKYYHGPFLQFRKTADLFVEKCLTERYTEIDTKIDSALRTIFDIGNENVKEEVTALSNEIDTQKSEIESELSNTSLSKIFNKTRKNGLMPWWLKNFFGMNGYLPEELHNYLTAETRLQLYRKTYSTLKNKLLKWGEVNKTMSYYALPSNSKLKEELQDTYIQSPDHSTGLNNLRKKIDEFFPEIILEVVKTNHNKDFNFDYDVSNNIYQSSGVIIPSNYRKELDFIVNYFHINQAYIKYISPQPGAISITLFALINKFSKIPEILNMIQRVDNNTEDDRRYYTRTVKEIFAPPYREKVGIPEERAALVLVQAFLTKGLMTTFNRKFERIAVNFDRGRKSFLNLTSFAEGLSKEAEVYIHDKFWEYFARNRSKSLLEIEKIKDEKVSESDIKRINTMKKFVGTKKWNNALEEIFRQVKIVDSYY